jgi:serine/threonine protein kinase
MPGPSTLVEMMIDIIDAVIYLDEQHLVHVAIMAANVLVGSNNVCKLTGFQFARQMSPTGQVIGPLLANYIHSFIIPHCIHLVQLQAPFN